MGRHFVREESDEESLQLALSSEVDNANIQGKEEKPLVTKLKRYKINIYFHRGLRKFFANDYARLFDSPVHSRLNNDVSGHSPTDIPAAG